MKPIDQLDKVRDKLAAIGVIIPPKGPELDQWKQISVLLNNYFALLNRTGQLFWRT